MIDKKKSRKSGVQTIDPTPAPTSVAHQIVEQFLSELAQQEGYSEIAGRLRIAALQSKPSEASLRGALFGDEAL